MQLPGAGLLALVEARAHFPVVTGVEQSSGYQDGAHSETGQHPFSRIGDAGMPGKDKVWGLGAHVNTVQQMRRSKTL